MRCPGSEGVLLPGARCSEHPAIAQQVAQGDVAQTDEALAEKMPPRPIQELEPVSSHPYLRLPSGSPTVIPG